MPEIVPLEWTGDSLRVLDQLMLPQEQSVVTAHTHTEVISALYNMQIRGSSLVAVAGSYALVLASKSINTLDLQRMFNYLGDAGKELANANPTNLSLEKAISRVLLAGYSAKAISSVRSLMEEEAITIHKEDLAANQLIGEIGSYLLPKDGTVLTFSNSGALATTGFGTALGAIRAAYTRSKNLNVIVSETRPMLEGSRLTMWELVQLGIPSTLIVDSAAGKYIASGKVDCVVVGGDRISSKGDIVGPIGTYPLAVIAHANEIPFYVMSPTSNIDQPEKTWDSIGLEERDSTEVLQFSKPLVTPKGIAIHNPSVDITPSKYVTGIVTEKGTIEPPFESELEKFSKVGTMINQRDPREILPG